MADHDYVALLKQGVTLLRQGQQTEALPLLEQAMQLDPTNDAACYHKGALLLALSRPEALDDYAWVIRLGRK
jgi:Flp pilus assembly protein TadD